MLYYYTKLTKNILTAFFLIFLVLPACAKKEKDYCRIIEIHDGDTVSIITGSFFGIVTKVERVRLTGIDAPELGQEPWGIKAKNHLRKLIKDTSWYVKIELDVQQRDRHGRLLAYLWDKNGRMLNYMMVRDGYAIVYTVPPNVKYVELLTEAQKLARQEKRGIWAKNGLIETPSQWRKKHPQNRVR